MGMMLQVIWQLMHLLLLICIIAFATVVPRSLGLGEPLSLESSSPIYSIDAQVRNSFLSRGPLSNAPLVQTYIESPSIKSPPVEHTIQGPLPFLSPRESATPLAQHDFMTPTPAQTTHDLAPPLSTESTNYPTFPTARARQDSSLPPVATVSVGSAPPLPVEPLHNSTPPPNDDNSNNWSMAPSTVSPHASSVSPEAKPPEAMPQLPTAEPPKTSSVASLALPPEVSHPTSTIQPPPVAEAPVISTPVTIVAPSHSSPQPPITESPRSIPLPLAVKPPESKPPMSVAEPPQGLTMTPPPTETPPLLPFPPPAMPPHISDMQSPLAPPNASASHASPAEVSPPTSTMQSPPFPAAEVPVVSIQPPVAIPPHSSALPLAAQPPESETPLPAAVPPQITLSPPSETPPNLPLLPPVPRNASSSPPYTYSPPPQSGLPHAPSPTSTVPSNPSLLPPSMVPPSQKPPTTLPSPSPPLSPDTPTPPPQLNPPIVSSPPPQLTPPIVFSPPQFNPPYASSPPPQQNPPTVSSPPLQPNPPVASSPPPELNPPIVSAPPPQLNPPSISFPPPQMNPPLLSAPPPQLNPPIVSSPPPELNPPSKSSPPPELNLPIVSSPPPEMNPPSVTSPPPEVDPPGVKSPPPELNPPSVLYPPPKLYPPISSSSPPQLVPPTLSSPPQLIPPPASSPTSVVPPNSAVPPPLIVPPPRLSSPPPAVSPHASAILSPLLPSHASPPLSQLVPPYASSPPYVLPTSPPLELPHVSSPRSHNVPGSVPPHVSPPSPFLAPPFAPTSPVNPSNPLYAPPPMESSHSSAPPLVAQRTVPAAPPHPSQSEEPQDRAPPPSPTSSEPSPPAHQVTPRSHPPSSHQIEAPKHAPFLRSNASEPDMSPTSTPPKKTRISGRKSSTAPPGRAPEQSPRDNLSPNHAPSKPRVERHNASASAPYPSKVNPTHIGSNHSWVKGSPQAMTPIPYPPEFPKISSAPSPLPGMAPPDHSGTPFLSPKISPSGSSTRDKKKPLAPPIMSLPPPPPNADCEYLTCPEPFTNTPPGSPCGCVWPMQVGLRLSVALFTFFPLVSELAREVAAGLFMKESQVRVMGANAASSESEKTIVLVDLVPLNEKFDNVTSYMTFQRFWQKQVVIDKSIFGDYDVLYVRYPGLPPSPPMAPADMAVINGMPYSVRDPNQSKVHPLGVDVPKQRHKHRLNGIVIAAIVLSAIVSVFICCSVAWILVLRHKTLDPQPEQTPRVVPSISRLSGPTGNSTGSGPSSSLSIGSSLATYAGSAKTFSTNEIEKATDNLSSSRIIGEGGFGLVYSGILEDETRVAVKVLKRDDQQGGREFLAEVEMLSRLHHRNLVKLIGICTDEHLRCLVYELIPNGSVDSHLHGADKEVAPLDWASRMKIALGAARGLAYLHEDSSPRVIHRDFKSSNILLEDDFTPKVSDFGLARSAMDEENKHISTRVMGTFGYVAPEYAMTGHLLVKSDVYSYGVVLLELLTGRKPVDMSQPPGQENIVAWTRPHLSTKEGLALILDPSIESDVHLDSVIKVAAIASMCVQPEVSHRPFMGEVVQALKLVCNECDDSKDGNSRPGSRENLSVDFEAKASPFSETQDYLPTQFSHQNFQSVHDVEKGLSVSEIFSSARVDRQTFDSFGTRRHSASGPLKTVRGQQFWQRIGRRSNGSVSEHGILYRLWAGSH